MGDGWGAGVIGIYKGRWVGRGRDGWGAGVMGRCKRRWLGFGSDREVQWAVGGARM